MSRDNSWVWWGIGALILFGGGVTVANLTLAERRRKYKPLFDTASAQYGIPDGLLMRQGEAESALQPDARSPAGAVGIMQIIPRWHPEVGESGALDPARAIPYAAKILRGWFDRFGSWELALAAYNAGPGNVEKYAGVPPFAETRSYIAKILG